MTNLNHVFLAWQCHASRKIMPVGRLVSLGESGFEFSYIRAARQAEPYGFAPLVSFPDLMKVYRSATLPALFSNRVMPTSRPDYPTFVRELGLREDATPLDVLQRSGGRRATDELEVFGRPGLDDSGFAYMHLLVRGVRHVPHAEAAIARLQVGERLLIVKDEQNSHSSYARILRTKDPAALVGYLPDYLALELDKLDVDVTSGVTVTVEQVNAPPAPVHHRLLCKLQLPAKHALFDGDEYLPISSDATDVAA